MNKKDEDKKKNRKILFALIIILSALITTTLLNGSIIQQRIKTIEIFAMGKMGSLGLVINEDSNESDAYRTSKGIIFENNKMPGQRVSKIVELNNTGSEPIYVRFSIEKVWYDQTGKIAEIDSGLINISGIDGDRYILVEKNGVTYYYLKEPLAPGSAVRIFNEFHLAEDIPFDYMNLDAKIIVEAEAVLAQNGAAYGYPYSLLEEQGWPVEIGDAGILILKALETNR